MLVGELPYNDNQRGKIDYESKLYWPTNFTDFAARDLLESMLNFNPNKRFKNPRDVLDHEWLKGITL